MHFCNQLFNFPLECNRKSAFLHAWSNFYPDVFALGPRNGLITPHDLNPTPPPTRRCNCMNKPLPGPDVRIVWHSCQVPTAQTDRHRILTWAVSLYIPLFKPAGDEMRIEPFRWEESPGFCVLLWSWIDNIAFYIGGKPGCWVLRTGDGLRI